MNVRRSYQRLIHLGLLVVGVLGSASAFAVKSPETNFLDLRNDFGARRNNYSPIYFNGVFECQLKTFNGDDKFLQFLIHDDDRKEQTVELPEGGSASLVDTGLGIAALFKVHGKPSLIYSIRDSSQTKDSYVIEVSTVQTGASKKASVVFKDAHVQAYGLCQSSEMSEQIFLIRQSVYLDQASVHSPKASAGSGVARSAGSSNSGQKKIIKMGGIPVGKDDQIYDDGHGHRVSGRNLKPDYSNEGRTYTDRSRGGRYTPDADGNLQRSGVDTSVRRDCRRRAASRGPGVRAECD